MYPNRYLHIYHADLCACTHIHTHAQNLKQKFCPMESWSSVEGSLTKWGASLCYKCNDLFKSYVIREAQLDTLFLNHVTGPAYKLPLPIKEWAHSSPCLNQLQGAWSLKFFDISKEQMGEPVPMPLWLSPLAAVFVPFTFTAFQVNCGCSCVDFHQLQVQCKHNGWQAWCDPGS